MWGSSVQGERRRRGWRVLAAAAATVCTLFAGGGCATPGVWSDFSSVSVGRSNEGRIQRPRKLPRMASGLVTPEAWRARGNRYGPDELVSGLMRAASKVKDQDFRARLGVADLSPRRGGQTIWHHSHHSGRDADLIFYSKNRRGRPMPPPEVAMVAYEGSGEPRAPDPGSERVQPDWADRRFDERLNWALVEALLSDPSIRVQWIFVSNPLRARLLRYAEKEARPIWVRRYAETVMRQPSASAPHDDHFHVRIYCSRADRARGCADTGPVWAHEKKTFKYDGLERYTPRRLSLPSAALFFPVG